MTQMADCLVACTGLSKGVARNAVNGVSAIIGDALADGEDVRLPGLGTFGPRKRSTRAGRNPRTSQAYSIRAFTLPKFKAGMTLKDTLNGARPIAMR